MKKYLTLSSKCLEIKYMFLKNPHRRWGRKFMPIIPATQETQVVGSWFKVSLEKACDPM
jgi:hypothetical protein